MTTIKVKWCPSTLEGEIYYQIMHNQHARQIKTEYKVFANEWREPFSMVSITNVVNERSFFLNSIHERINQDVKRLNTIIKNFDYCGCEYTTDDVVDVFVSQSRNQSFFSFMKRVITQLKILNKHRTAENYITTLNSFSHFCNNEDLLLCEINSDLLMRYEAYLADRSIMKNTVSFYMRILRAVYNRAVEQKLIEQQNPFKHVYTGIDKTIKRAINFATIKQIKELDLSSLPTLDFARDMFLFSFYTRGMSFIDMAYLRKSDLKNGMISYRRRKTGQQLVIKWERCMQEIVSKYEQGSNYSQVPKASHYLLPILRPPFDKSRIQYRNILQQINRSLKTIAQLVRLDVPLTMYVARHSWANIAKSKNIPISIISEGMGHNSETTTQIYLASLDTTVIDRANNLILRGL